MGRLDIITGIIFFGFLVWYLANKLGEMPLPK